MRAFFSASIVTALSLAAPAALAQVPPPAAPPPAYGVPGYGVPGYGAPAYGAPAYGAPAYGAPAYGAQPPAAPSGEINRPYSSTMFGVGVTMIVAGTSAALVGSALYGVGSKKTYEYPTDCVDYYCEPTINQKTGLKYGGATMIALGTTALAVGIPLMLVGMRRVAIDPKPSAFVPAVRVGPGGGSVTWRF
jgi:hypothetical protein